MARDPKEEFFSSYVYCGNNPLGFVDPDGEWIVEWGAGLMEGMKIKIGVNDNQVTMGLSLGFTAGAFFSFSPLTTTSDKTVSASLKGSMVGILNMKRGKSPRSLAYDRKGGIGISHKSPKPSIFSSSVPDNEYIWSLLVEQVSSVGYGTIGHSFLAEEEHNMTLNTISYNTSNSMILAPTVTWGGYAFAGIELDLMVDIEKIFDKASSALDYEMGKIRSGLMNK